MWSNNLIPGEVGKLFHHLRKVGNEATHQRLGDHGTALHCLKWIIDAQLREAGWEADSQNLNYAKGTKPTKGRNLAIAEYPTRNGLADYALFVGLQIVAIVEAKRQCNTN